MNPVYTQAKFINSSPHLSNTPPDQGMEVAFAGRSNAGKSSAINTLTRQHGLARISKTPGRTQMLNFFEINARQRFVDLPGYGYAKVPEQIRAGWKKLVEDYISQRQNVNMVFVLIDSRHEPTYLDELMVSWLEYYEIPYAIILTKSDKISQNKMEKQIYRSSKIVNNEDLCKDYIPFSIITGEGKNEIVSLIEEQLKKSNN